MESKEFKGIEKRDTAAEHRELNQKIDKLVEGFNELQSIVAIQNLKIDNQVQDTKDLISAWNTAKGLPGLIKWLVTICVGLLGIWGFVKGVKS